MEPYVILGACNPQLAHRALDVEREIGLLLPCNVVVRTAQDATTIVQALDPQVMVAVPEREELQPIADEAGRHPGRARLAHQAVRWPQVMVAIRTVTHHSQPPRPPPAPLGPWSALGSCAAGRL